MNSCKNSKYFKYLVIIAEATVEEYKNRVNDLAEFIEMIKKMENSNV